jgi:hypothetical protein
MTYQLFESPTAGNRDALALDVSIIMPCLNEIECLPHCIANARAALDRMETLFGIAGEIVVADNGSHDGSQVLAASLGARVVDVSVKGYGAALIGGAQNAFGQYLLMGDADGSYDFMDGVAMIERLIKGGDLCMGSRFQGGIAAGAMPWKNRYIGNPALTGLLNLFFRSGIDDAHCGLRAIRRDCFIALNLSGTGMEFASEMVIKATLKDLRISQVPAKLLRDRRSRAPHLRPWRDGWRHLRYLLMLSPTWVFGVPAIAAMALALVIFLTGIMFATGVLQGQTPVGTSWTIVAGYLLSVGHVAAMMALATHFHGVRLGYRRMRPWLERPVRWITLESALIVGGAMMLLAIFSFAAITISWSIHGFTALPSVLPLTLAAAIGAIGMQTALGGFLLAIIAGHDVRLAPMSYRHSDLTLKLAPA